jgi:hypothetical protein
MTLVFCATFGNAHSADIHALQDLNAAGCLIEHRSGDWARTADEFEAQCRDHGDEPGDRRLSRAMPTR